MLARHTLKPTAMTMLTLLAGLAVSIMINQPPGGHG